MSVDPHFRANLESWLETEPVLPFEFGSAFLGETELGATCPDGYHTLRVW